MMKAFVAEGVLEVLLGKHRRKRVIKELIPNQFFKGSLVQRATQQELASHSSGAGLSHCPAVYFMKRTQLTLGLCYSSSNTLLLTQLFCST